MLRRRLLLFVLCALITMLAVPLQAIPPLPRRGASPQKTSSAAVEERVRHVETDVLWIPMNDGLELLTALAKPT